MTVSRLQSSFRHMNFQPVFPRGRDINEQHRASTPLELLFDLTFVVAIASASSQLHHGVVEHHVGQAIVGYLLAFLCIWWAWMNYTWFASAYDDDDTVFRVLTMIQMGGVLLLATAIPGLFSGQYVAGVLGYVIMRLALCLQWLRAAQGDPPRRRTCLRYAAGVAVVQAGWIIFLLLVLNGSLAEKSLVITMAGLWLCELMVPIWAESAGETPWHAHHIAERYGLMVIIVLGECVLGASNSLASMWQSQGWSFDLLLVGFAGILLIFSLWWTYFLLPSANAIHHHRERAWVWGYGHFVIFASVAAIGSGLEVVADVLNTTQEAGAHTGSLAASYGVSPLAAIGMVALAEAIFMTSLWILHSYVVRPTSKRFLLLFSCLAAIAAGPIAVSLGVPLPWGLILLSFGPILAIAPHEKQRPTASLMQQGER